MARTVSDRKIACPEPFVIDSRRAAVFVVADRRVPIRRWLPTLPAITSQWPACMRLLEHALIAADYAN